MIKGVSRNVIVVNPKGKSKFEAVYFIVKKGTPCSREDIVGEANRIVLEGQAPTERRRVGRKAQMILGILLGILFSSLLWLAVILIAF